MLSYGSPSYGSAEGAPTITPPTPPPVVNVVSIIIAGVDRTAYVDWASIQIQQYLTKQQDQLQFNIKNYGTKTYRPADGDEIFVLLNTVRVFGGNVVELDETIDGLARTTQVTALPYSAKLDSQLVSKNYENILASAIIADLLANFTDGSFTMNNVNANVMIPSVVFNYVAISECMKKLVSLLPNYDWYVDYNKDIHFFQVGTVFSPFNITDSNGNMLNNTLEVISDGSQIANDIIIAGGKVTGSTARTEYESGDGNSLNFPLGNDFASVPTVTVSGVVQTVGIDGVDQDTAFQAMWNQSSQLIRFTSGNTPPAGTNNIAVTGIPRFSLTYEKENQTSISQFGRKSKKITDATIQDIATASARADAELAFYAFPVGTAEFTTQKDGLVVGQYINITSSARSLNQNYKIQQITITCLTPSTLSYDVQLQTANSVNMNDVLNLLLIQNPASQNPPDPNTIIERISLFPESANITDTLHTPTQSSPPYKWGTMKWGLFTWHT